MVSAVHPVSQGKFKSLSLLLKRSHLHEPAKLKIGDEVGMRPLVIQELQLVLLYRGEGCLRRLLALTPACYHNCASCRVILSDPFPLQQPINKYIQYVSSLHTKHCLANCYDKHKAMHRCRTGNVAAHIIQVYGHSLLLTRVSSTM